MTDSSVIECPNPKCRAINLATAEFCTKCETDLRGLQPESPPAAAPGIVKDASPVAGKIAPANDEEESPAEESTEDDDESAEEDAVEEGGGDAEPEPEQETGPDDAEAESGQPEPEAAVNPNGWGIQAREMFVEEMAQKRLTIGVIGNYDVGKTFFINQLAEVAKSKGYTHEKLMIDPNVKISVQQQTTFGQRAPELKESETFVGTLNIWVHDFIIAEDENCFRLIDIPGEFFSAALGDKRVHKIDDGRVAMLYPALGISDAIILIVPSHHVFPTVNIQARRSVELLGDIRRVSNLLEAVKANHNGDFAAAVEEVLGWDAAMLRTQLTQLSQGLSKKPTMALFSQADRCFGVSPARDPKGVGMDVPEHDPLLCAARQLPTLVNQLHRGFEDFRIDFLTSAEGQPQDSKDFHVGTPSIGVWPPIEWLRQRVALRQAAEPERGRFSRLWNRMLKTDRLRDDERTSGWAIDLRIKADREFRSALRR